MARMIRLQPISGKYVSVTSHGAKIRIWLVPPGTKEQGTEVTYEDAIELLSLRHPVVCEAQIKGKDGKFIKQLTAEDWEKINERKNSIAQLAEVNSLHPEHSEVSGNNPALTQLVETQAKLIEAQSKQLETMQKGFEEMQKNMEKLLKKGGKKNEKPAEE